MLINKLSYNWLADYVDYGVYSPYDSGIGCYPQSLLIFPLAKYCLWLKFGQVYDYDSNIN